MIECYGCGRPIPFGQPFMNVTYSLEHTSTAGFAGFIEVERAESLLTMCQDCAPPASRIADALRRTGLPVPQHAGEM